jgi:hypothetical protein
MPIEDPCFCIHSNSSAISLVNFYRGRRQFKIPRFLREHRKITKGMLAILSSDSRIIRVSIALCLNFIIYRACYSVSSQNAKKDVQK